MKNTGLFVLALVLLAVGVAGLLLVYSLGTFRVSPGGTSATGRYSSAGERIFQSGLDASGDPIGRSSLPISEGFLMMGGGGCASCHGPDGRGGTVGMMMGSIKAPNVTYAALVEEGFTKATIRRAIIDGLDEGGEQLDETMPRWKMNDAEVNDVISYLKELSTR